MDRGLGLVLIGVVALLRWNRLKQGLGRVMETQSTETLIQSGKADGASIYTHKRGMVELTRGRCCLILLQRPCRSDASPERALGTCIRWSDQG